MSNSLDNHNRRERDAVEHWHLDKRVPLSIIFALVLQTIYFTVFITKLDSRVSVLEQSSIDTRKTIQDMAEIKIHQQYIREHLKDLKDFLKEDVDWIKPKKQSGN